MCGIAGFVDPNRREEEMHPLLEAMSRTLACRGPDGAGRWVGAPAGHAHRRLVVVDPEGGAQPMTLTWGGRTYVINYNGELYNTEELRRELFARGHRFRGHSDTEVLLHAYAQWGAGCLGRVNGIFAFAVWCPDDQSLFLARDRLGVKPLFYAERGGALVYASEMKALLAHPLVPPEVDAEGLAEVLAMGPARTPGHGIFRAVRELRPGWALRATPEGVRRWRYWALESRPHLDDLATTAERVRWLLRDSVERQLVSDVPVCTLLSGGLDSSAVTAFAAARFSRAGREPLCTYSVDFADMDRYFRPGDFQTGRDAPWVERMSRHLGTCHHRVELDTPELVDALERSLVARDHPGMADVDTSLLLFARRIKEDATVALSGEAADEIFGGYPWCHRPDALAADTFPWALRLADRVRLIAPEVKAAIRPEAYVADRYREALAEVPRLPGEEPAEARLREVLYLNITRFLPTLLDRKDRMTMAVGLEVRVPFCDHRLVEYVWNIPWWMKRYGGVAKGILRLALTDVLPADVVARRKSPYPSTHNPAYGLALRERLRAVLADPLSPLGPLLDRQAVEDLMAVDLDTTALPWFGQLMGVAQMYAYLLQTDAWLRRYRVRIAA
ncbi:MAG: asparagine synthase (glutamine-hydrolyzing) [Firmicutes bacterium]|nr:asparagine synthase (glutamine-hydrolyzing) [Bacillota bacterium]